MPKQLGRLPGSEFPDKSLEIALKGYLSTLEKDQRVLLDSDSQNISIGVLDTIEDNLRELANFLEKSRSAQAILPYRLLMLKDLNQARAELSVAEELMRDKRRDPRSLAVFLDSLLKTRDSITSIQQTLKVGLSRPLYPKSR